MLYLKFFIFIFSIKNSFQFQHPYPNKYMSYSNVKLFIRNLYEIKCKSYNLEHIVPQSVFKGNKKLKTDMHNIILYPAKMNLHRSNYEYISNFVIYPNSKLIDSSGNEIEYIEPIKDQNICIKTSNKRYFLPEKKYRGLISRSCMYVLSTYSEYKDHILNNVINPYTLLTWHHQYPVTEFEKKKNDKIFEQQGNRNEFISKPELLTLEMEDILNTRFKAYEKYKY